MQNKTLYKHKVTNIDINKYLRITLDLFRKFDINFRW